MDNGHCLYMNDSIINENASDVLDVGSSLRKRWIFNPFNITDCGYSAFGSDFAPVHNG
jgi:hypothetical protein